MEGLVMRKASKIALSVSLCVICKWSFAIDYINIEKKSSEILCQSSPSTCVPYEAVEESNATSTFIVSGVELPGDALRDNEQQMAMVPAGLYIKKDGSVSQIAVAKEASVTVNNQIKSKVFPIKTFTTPPPISGTNSPIVISTGSGE
jgi:hypothetical protein